jgi:hypothetical protein
MSYFIHVCILSRVVVEAISAADWNAIQKSDVPAPKKSKK